MIRSYLDIYRECSERPDELLVRFVEKWEEIRQEVVRHQGTTMSIVFPGKPVRLNYIRCALMMSDLFAMTYTGNPNVAIVPLPGIPVRRIVKTIPGRGQFAEPFVLEGYAITSRGFISSSGPDFVRVFRYLKPVIDSGHLMLVPHGVLIGQPMDQSRQDGQFRMFGVDHWQPIKEWTNKCTGNDKVEERADASIPMSADLEQILVPFLDGVPLKTFAEVLKGEADRLTTFRAALRKATRQIAEQSSNASEIVNDVIRPELDALQSRLRQVSLIRGLRVGGAAVATVGATLVASKWPDMAPVLGPAVAGGAGLYATIREIAELAEKRLEATASPWYPLWRLNRARVG